MAENGLVQGWQGNSYCFSLYSVPDLISPFQFQKEKDSLDLTHCMCEFCVNLM